MRTRLPQLSVLLTVIAWTHAHAASGDVDPSFVYPRPAILEPDSTNAIALDDGFLVIKSLNFDKAGSNSTLEVTRIDEDGHPMPAFGSDGKVVITMPGAVNVSSAVKGLVNGSMLLAGFRRLVGPTDDNAAAIVRLDSSGRLDPTFGTGGVATVDVPGQQDRVGAIGVLADGRILAGVWSRMALDAYGDCSTDRVSLVRLNADGTASEVIYYRERNAFSDNGCRNTMTLQVMPDQRFYFGSNVEIVEFSAPEVGAWKALFPLGCCAGPFAVDTTLGPVWTYQSSYGGWLDSSSTYHVYGPRKWFPEASLSFLGIPAPRTVSMLVGDGRRPGWFLGVSSDGGIAGIAKLRPDGGLDTGWAAGHGMVRIEGAGRPDTYANEGLADDIRLMDSRPGGKWLVVVTADGVIERLFAESDPAHGAIHFVSDNLVVQEAAGAVPVRVLRDGGSDGAVSVDYRVFSAGTDRECFDDPCAQPGEDFVATSGRLEWGNGDDSERDILISIVDDKRHEPGEVFWIELTGLTGGAVILDGQSRLIGITDDDPEVPTGTTDGAGGSVGGGSGGGGSINWLLLALFGAIALVRAGTDAAVARRTRALASGLDHACRRRASRLGRYWGH